MKCSSCGHRVIRRARYCDACGAPLFPRSKSAAVAPANSRSRFFGAVLLSAGIAVGALLMYFATRPTSSKQVHGNFDPSLRGEVLAAQYPLVYEVASQFLCPCGSCNDGLEVCDCDMKNGAFQVRREIHQLLQVHEVPHVIELLATRYGHRKTGASSPASLWQKPGASLLH
ncbi:MAG: zinc ribbon domain-containing protein [candidate division KSB1 bacterium]|nr:zinc ribbon domain-containing protein [candidate division KSB1 bacterium]MDZ7275598.1 zinc ribbon domain-containing protein [candidate division KSB1 bacterium]MDZ7284711.1 zinc ribbon domain-containing protein [candidate division KSB1 bacterium]MDZ7297870.1 zinc ribbon domain-containing protein [candidate division KSB1 bacterium]MDZ7306002.1 zinc ribbon domain-containing protein [candidate division KSB1 bacterium]